MENKKILIIAGARPNFMKIAPLIKEIKKHSNRLNYYLVHTGQHYDKNLSKIFFDELEIPKPNINLKVGSGNKNYQITEIKRRFEPILLKENPNLVVVVGDVNSTIACASAAKKLNIKVAHIEAGLRSFDLAMPEEHNRIETDAISDYLFTTEENAYENLIKEGVNKNKIFFVGNLMIDTLIKNIEKAKKSDIRKKLGLEKRNFAVSTIHRPSNVDKKEDLLKILSILDYIQKKIKIVLPLHPRTKTSIEKFGLNNKIKIMKNLIVTEPLGYLDFLNLILNSKFVLTDSGGIQEEATYLKIPCITMRFNTERPITVTQGSNVIVGNNKEKLISEFNKIMYNKFKKSSIPKYWDGDVAKRIIEILLKKI